MNYDQRLSARMLRRNGKTGPIEKRVMDECAEIEYTLFINENYAGLAKLVMA
jgi:hypothetical protein